MNRNSIQYTYLLNQVVRLKRKYEDPLFVIKGGMFKKSWLIKEYTRLTEIEDSSELNYDSIYDNHFCQQ